MRRLPSRRSRTRPTSLSTFRCCETAGRLTGSSPASSPTSRGPSESRSRIAWRVGSPRAVIISDPFVTTNGKLLLTLLASSRAAEDRAQRVEHLLLALADELGVEAEEPALLRRLRRALGGLPQPVAELRGLFGRRLLEQQRVDRAQLVEDLVARARPGRPEAGHRVLAVAGLVGDLPRHLFDELAVPAALRRLQDRPERGAGLLDRLDRAAGVGERDRHAGHERRAPEADPFLFSEVVSRRHVPDATHLQRVGVPNRTMRRRSWR